MSDSILNTPLNTLTMLCKRLGISKSLVISGFYKDIDINNLRPQFRLWLKLLGVRDIPIFERSAS